MLNYHERIKNHTIITGGLDFCDITFSNNSPIIIEHIDDNDNDKYTNTIKQNAENHIIKDVGKKINIDMAFDKRIPLQFDGYIDNDIHQKLSDNLRNIGVIDMWIKQQNSNLIVMPKELFPIEQIIKKIYDFESLINSDILKWNMWLLVDCRSVTKGCTQRNAGFHYDGLNLSGKYAETNMVSIYSWTNVLPTLFYDSELNKVSELYNLSDKDKINVNMSAYAQMKMNKKYILKSKPNSLIKFDGATLHAGASTKTDINNRVFIRVCFTPENVWFDRIGNTVNPHLIYPKSFKWRKVKDPSTRLINPVFYKNEQEFKNVWDVACLGHHAFCTMYEKRSAYEYQLIKSLRSTKGLNFMRNIKKLYDKDNTVFSKQRYEILQEKYFL